MFVMQLGLIGLGNIGAPVSRHLLEAGHEVVVSDLDQDAVDRLVAAGATAVDSPKAVAEQSDVVFLALPGPDAVESVALGSEGLVEGFSEGDTLVDLTTSSPPVTRSVADALGEHGVAVVSAPVAGGKYVEEKGLAIMAGGDPAVVEALEELFADFSKDLIHVGEQPEAGDATKLINNYIFYSGLVAAAEGITLGKKVGLDVDDLIEVINKGTGMNYATVEFMSELASGDYELPASYGIMEKDMRVFNDFAEAQGAPVMLGAVTNQIIQYGYTEYEGETCGHIVKYIEDTMRNADTV